MTGTSPDAHDLFDTLRRVSFAESAHSARRHYGDLGRDLRRHQERTRGYFASSLQRRTHELGGGGFSGSFP